jgi:hypothetical protein
MKTIKNVLNILHGRTIGHLNFKDSFSPTLALIGLEVPLSYNYYYLIKP